MHWLDANGLSTWPRHSPGGASTPTGRRGRRRWRPSCTRVSGHAATPPKASGTNSTLPTTNLAAFDPATAPSRPCRCSRAYTSASMTSGVVAAPALSAVLDSPQVAVAGVVAFTALERYPTIAATVRTEYHFIPGDVPGGRTRIVVADVVVALMPHALRSLWSPVCRSWARRSGMTTASSRQGRRHPRVDSAVINCGFRLVLAGVSKLTCSSGRHERCRRYCPRSHCSCVVACW
ncbi:hypothetical protein BN6_20935 [Saccharothrix espanaensis DSM 44229]|uniref:Uncharacterized protein n=1 Tax=Saccharothrix espanaensis (strain ATCC 51144 / DSM 44229 / JCM 9112 / NBRC 15066 / NRRL 15764) TaxID=1179773 RepID=K0JXD1_SACES|nr:hypothetical protein BN6_20935 [Saccharothrix espanaensis DSM 44229]